VLAGLTRRLELLKSSTNSVHWTRFARGIINLGERELQVKTWASCIDSATVLWGDNTDEVPLATKAGIYSQQSEGKNLERWMEAEGARPFEEHYETRIDSERCRDGKPPSRDALSERRMNNLLAIHSRERPDTKLDGHTEERQTLRFT
jgi:hypothetical protein